MPQTDTGNFNKLLASVGLLLLGAALVIPYFFFRNTDILSLPSRDLRGMTETGRAALLDRQDAITAMEPWVAVAALLLALLGVTLLITGASRLRSAQARDDEESELRRRRTQLEVDEMSPAEQAQKNAERAKSELEEESAKDARRSAWSDQVPAPTEQTTSPRVQSDWQGAWTSRMKVISRVSERIHQVFKTWEIGSYEFKWQVRIGSASAHLQIDALFEARIPGLPDILFTDRLVGDALSVQRSARNAANDVIALIGRYEGLTGRKARGWLVNVIPEESEGGVWDEPVDALNALRGQLAGFGNAVILREKELDSLPELFSELFGPE